MDDIYTILWVVFWVSAALHVWVGKVFISQPDYNVPAVFRNPLMGKVLVLTPQLGFLVVAIGGFLFTDHGWWFLGSVIATILIFSSRPESF